MATNLYGKKPSTTPVFNTIVREQEKIYGLGWPNSKESEAPYFRKTSSSELIKGLVRQVIGTNKGERVMLPKFGVSIRKYLFEPFTQNIATSVAYEIRTQVQKYVPLVNIEAITVISDENLQGYGLSGFIIKVVYREKETNVLVELEVKA